ncbi:MAG: adenosylcobinamide-phosphate synthase CbiB, partial [Hyphomicrobium sp.]
MTADSIFLVLGLALVVDAAFGYSDVVYRKIGHPVTWIGAMISAADKHFNRQDASFAVRKAVGAVALGAIVGGAALVAALVQGALAQAPGGVIVLAIVAATLIAARSLYDHVRNVAAALEGEGIEGGRRSVAMIVGRDTAALDESGVARAAIESLAENASDGVVAPAFWFAVAGLPGLAAYKAINTADSMIGHRSPRHLAFGFAAAKLDDLVNLVPARLSGLVIAVAATLMGRRGWDGLGVMWRDARKHASPNAGWPEAAMAG